VVLDAWGDFNIAAHGLSVVMEEEREVIFISDHSAGGKAYKTTLDGEVLMTISSPMESDLCQEPAEFEPAKTPHFPGGEFFVIDGYGKDDIHRYLARRVNGSRRLEETSERAKRSSSTRGPTVSRSRPQGGPQSRGECSQI